MIGIPLHCADEAVVPPPSTFHIKFRWHVLRYVETIEVCHVKLSKS